MRALHIPFALSLITLAGCPQSPAPDADVDCAGRALTTTLAADADFGYAPADIGFEGAISLLESVDYTWRLDYGNGTFSEGRGGQPSAVGRYEEPGRFEAVLTVVDDVCGRTEQSSATVEIAPRVELAVRDVVASPSNVRVTEALRITAKIENTAAAPMGSPFGVAIFLAQGPSPHWDGIGELIPLRQLRWTPLAAGATENLDERVELPRTLASGSYWVVVVADPLDEVGETDETGNNLASSVTAVVVDNDIDNAPDVAVLDLAIAPTAVFREMRSVNVTANLRNLGTRAAPGTVWTLSVSGREAYTSAPVNLEPGIEGELRLRGFPVEIDPPFTDLGTASITVCASTLGDSAADNDCSIALVEVSEEPVEGADIYLADFGFAPRETFLGGTVGVRVDVENAGTQRVGTFFCGVYLTAREDLEPAGAMQLANLHVSRLEPGESRALEMVAHVPVFFGLGTFHAFAACDPSRAVEEINEANNVRALPEPVTIHADANIDLRLRSFDFAPSDIEDGDEVRVYATVGNDGTTGSGPSTLELRIRGLEGGAERTLTTAVVPALSAGEEVELEIVVQSTSCDVFRDAYRVGAVVDPANQIPEVNEENNASELEALQIRGARCSCEEDVILNNDRWIRALPLSAGDHGPFTLCAPGDRDYYGVDLEAGQSLAVQVRREILGPCTAVAVRLLGVNGQPEVELPGSQSRTDDPVAQVSWPLVPQSGRYYLEVRGRGECDVSRYGVTLDVRDPVDGIDLAGADLRLDDDTPPLLSTVTASFTHINFGAQAAPPHTVAFFLTGEGELDGEERLLANLQSDGLGGAQVDRAAAVEFEIPRDVEPGSYTPCAVIDPGNAVVEATKANNKFCGPEIEVDGACFDRFETNDTASDAAEIAPGEHTLLGVCASPREDWYRFCAESGNELDLTVTFDGDPADIDVELYTEGESLLDASSTIGDEERVSVDFVDGDQCYLARVFLTRGEQAEYDMDLDVREGVPCDNWGEPNGSLEQAVASGSRLALAIGRERLDACPRADIDLYALELAAGITAEVCAENHVDNPVEHTINLAILDPIGRQLAGTSGTSPCLTHRAQLSGTYFVRVLVVGRDQRSAGYTLDLRGVFGVDLRGENLRVEPDVFVPGRTEAIYDFDLLNLRTDAAGDVTYGVYWSSDPIIDPQNDLLLATGEVAAVDGLARRHVEGVVSIPEHPALRADGYFGIYLDPEEVLEEVNEANNRLHRAVEILYCEPDRFAGNGAVASAVPLTVGMPESDLTLCPGEHDWFCARPVAAGEYRATLTFSLPEDDPRAGDLQLEVWEVEENEPGRQLGQDIGLGDGAQVSFTVQETGDVCFEVRGLRDGSLNTYAIELE